MIDGGTCEHPFTATDPADATMREFASARGSQYIVFDRDCTGRPDPARCRSMLTESATFLGVGECEERSCMAMLPPGRAIDVDVVADPDESSEECYERNNVGVQPNVAGESVQ